MTYLPALPVVLPLTIAAVLVAGSSLLSRRVRDTIAIVTAAAVVALCAVLCYRSLDSPIVYWLGGWTPRDGVAIGICLVIDPLGAGLATMSATLVTASLVFSWRYFDEIGSLYVALMMIFLGALDGFCLTGDLFNLFVFFELMSVSAYALTGYKIEEQQALMGAFNFAITNSVGAFLVLTGLGMLYGRAGALNLAQLGEALADKPPDALVIVALTLITSGFLVKAAAVPFHFWLADAHAVAPTPVCVLFSGVMVEAGVYAVARVYWTVFAPAIGSQAPSVRQLWMAIGVVTTILGAFMCLASRHLKRRLAFSTVSHTGLFLVGVALLSPRGLAGAGVYIVGHGLVKGALFLGAGILLNRFGSVDENTLHGLGRPFRTIGVLFLIGGLALSGLPPFGTHVGKSMIDEAASEAGHAWLKVLSVLVAALTGGAVLRAAGQIFLGIGARNDSQSQTPTREDKETDENYDRPPAVMFYAAATLLALALAAGLWKPLEHHAVSAARRFEDSRAYAATVLGESKQNPSAIFEEQRSPGHSVLLGFLSTAGAIVVAFLSLFPNALPQPLRVATCKIFGPPSTLVHELHSGNVADYVTWVTVGVSVIGGALAVSILGPK